MECAPIIAIVKAIRARLQQSSVSTLQQLCDDASEMRLQPIFKRLHWFQSEQNR